MRAARSIRPGMIAFWMLNDASTVREKVEYMRACRAGGIEALCMHCRAGNLVPYSSDEWFAMIRDLVEAGRRMDMDVWLYDEDPFPSGAVGGMVMARRPDLRALGLVCHEPPPDLKPGGLWCIGEQKVLWAGLVPVGEPLEAVELTGQVGMVRTDWFMGRWDSRFYYDETPIFPCPRGNAVRPRFAMRVPDVAPGHKLVALTAEIVGEDGTWGTLPDLLSYEAFALFKELALDRYAGCVGHEFGKTIPGIFTDEAKPQGRLPVTGDLFESFEQTYGYDLHPRLHRLFGDPLSEDYVRTRLDYRGWVAERFLDAFVRPYRRYCDRHGLHLVGHFSPEDDPLHETMYLGSVMPVMKAMSLPGTDVIVPFTGDSTAPVLNIGSLRVGSLKSQHGRPYAMSETLALTGWAVTSDKCRQILAWQKALGLDRFFAHGFFTSSEGVQNYEAPPDYGPHSSVFKGMCAVNEWLKRVESLMDGAEEEADVAVLSSVISFWTWGPGMDESRLRRMRRPLWLSVLACLQAHVGLHVVSEEDLSEAKVETGRIVVGRRAYSSVLVPAADMLGRAALAVLRSAARNGVAVTWFGGGPKHIVGKRHRLRDCPSVPGEALRQEHPSAAWCRRRFRPQAAIAGRNKEQCYVRRFTGRDREHYLLATNLSEGDLALRLGAEEGGLAWLPVEVDGEAVVSPRATTWRLPARGCGLFRLGRPRKEGKRQARPVRRVTGKNRIFKRLGPNILRLDRCTAVGKGKPPVELDYPRPYWQLFSDFSARRTWPTFLGEVPLESTVPEGDLRYSFAFAVKGQVSVRRLVLDPRCARGRCQVFLNGRRIGGWRVFPLDRTHPLRVPLRGLRQGANTVELRFRVQGAMEGLLSQLYLEGDFDADVDVAGRRGIAPPAGRISASGWQEAGLPHYMGQGLYRWREHLSGADAARAWTLEFDEILDSAELFVNGASLGVRAWRPWRWTLPGLKEGANTFELLVSGTAGNKHELDWPNQPQGWVGGACFVAEK